MKKKHKFLNSVDKLESLNFVYLQSPIKMTNKSKYKKLYSNFMSILIDHKQKKLDSLLSSKPRNLMVC